MDSGPNGLQNKPLITSAKTSSTKTTITGKLQRRPNSGFTIEFFSNPSANEGKKFIGQKSIVNTDASGRLIHLLNEHQGPGGADAHRHGTVRKPRRFQRRHLGVLRPQDGR